MMTSNETMAPFPVPSAGAANTPGRARARPNLRLAERPRRLRAGAVAKPLQCATPARRRDDIQPQPADLPARGGEPPPTLLIVIADVRQARIFCRTGDDEAAEIERLTRGDRADDARPRPAQPAPAEGSTGGRRKARPRGDADFAAEIAAYLQLAAEAEGVAGFVLVAPPVFLELVHARLAPAARRLMLHTFAEDLGDAPAQLIRERLRKT
jgi:hypothetical protein